MNFAWPNTTGFILLTDTEVSAHREIPTGSRRSQVFYLQLKPTDPKEMLIGCAVTALMKRDIMNFRVIDHRTIDTSEFGGEE